MIRSGRRAFLRVSASAGLLGVLAPSIRRALALPARRRSGSIADVEHVIVCMQENRAFDHYFGHLAGVRGINDRHPVRRADGFPVWFQPRRENPAASVLPFHLATHRTSAECVLDLDHNWYPTQAALAAGRNDRWPAEKSDLTMGYYTRADIPFHYALADAFTICDNYFCSTPTQTHPNRMYLMTGTLDPTGTGGGPLLDNIDYVDRAFTKRKRPPFTWTTYPERLEAAGISWQIYQQGLSPSDPYHGNFGTNVLMDFRRFIEAGAGSALARRAMAKRTLGQFAADALAGRLSQVSWLLPPAAYSEHPRWTPGYGALYLGRVLDALTANPEVWGTSVLLVMWDENDGYFDHVPPPQPPTPVLPGHSTVSTAGEVHDFVNPFDRDKFHADNLPYGLGPRVALLAISPWSKGGFVCSEVFDHTSVIRFIERRFGVREPNITPWRRAVCGDLTAAFDFAHPNDAKPVLPSTSGILRAVDRSCRLPAPAVPEVSEAADMGAEEPGTRRARALPYDLALDEILGPPRALSLRFANLGGRAACFYAYREGSTEVPRRYTVGAGAALEDAWLLARGEVITIAGPNGFLRRYRRQNAPTIRVAARADAKAEAIVLALTNDEEREVAVTIRDAAYGAAPRMILIPPRSVGHLAWSVAASGGWYDILVRDPGGAATRLAGHLETGRPSVTDPAASAPVLARDLLFPG